MKTTFLLFAVASMSLCCLHAEPSAERRCTDSRGRLLYIVRGDEVRDASNRLLGTVKNGEVRSPSGKLIAKHGDAGLLYLRID